MEQQPTKEWSFHCCSPEKKMVKVRGGNFCKRNCRRVGRIRKSRRLDYIQLQDDHLLFTETFCQGIPPRKLPIFEAMKGSPAAIFCADADTSSSEPSTKAWGMLSGAVKLRKSQPQIVGGNGGTDALWGVVVMFKKKLRCLYTAKVPAKFWEVDAVFRCLQLKI